MDRPVARRIGNKEDREQLASQQVAPTRPVCRSLLKIEIVMNDNVKNTEHREQDPAEGSHEIVDRELERQDNKAGQRAAAGRPTDPTPTPLKERPQINQKK